MVYFFFPLIKPFADFFVLCPFLSLPLLLSLTFHPLRALSPSFFFACPF